MSCVHTGVELNMRVTRAHEMCYRALQGRVHKVLTIAKLRYDSDLYNVKRPVVSLSTSTGVLYTFIHIGCVGRPLRTSVVTDGATRRLAVRPPDDLWRTGGQSSRSI